MVMCHYCFKKELHFLCYRKRKSDYLEMTSVDENNYKLRTIQTVNSP